MGQRKNWEFLPFFEPVPAAGIRSGTPLKPSSRAPPSRGNSTLRFVPDPSPSPLYRSDIPPSVRLPRMKVLPDVCVNSPIFSLQFSPEEVFLRYHPIFHPPKPILFFSPPPVTGSLHILVNFVNSTVCRKVFRRLFFAVPLDWPDGLDSSRCGFHCETMRLAYLIFTFP